MGLQGTQHQHSLGVSSSKQYSLPIQFPAKLQAPHLGSGSLSSARCQEILVSQLFSCVFHPRPLLRWSPCSFDSHLGIPREMFSRPLKFGGRKECGAFIFTFETWSKHITRQLLVNMVILTRQSMSCASKVSRKQQFLFFSSFYSPHLYSCNIRTERI